MDIDLLYVTNAGNGEVLATVQPICEKLPPGQDDAPRNYTPYIKYTKLEFKV